MTNRSGPRALPCGIPLITDCQHWFEMGLLIVLSQWFYKKFLCFFIRRPMSPNTKLWPKSIWNDEICIPLLWAAKTAKIQLVQTSQSSYTSAHQEMRDTEREPLTMISHTNSKYQKKNSTCEIRTWDPNCDTPLKHAYTTINTWIERSSYTLIYYTSNRPNCRFLL